MVLLGGDVERGTLVRRLDGRLPLDIQHRGELLIQVPLRLGIGECRCFLLAAGSVRALVPEEFVLEPLGFVALHFWWGEGLLVVDCLEFGAAPRCRVKQVVLNRFKNPFALRSLMQQRIELVQINGTSSVLRALGRRRLRYIIDIAIVALGIHQALLLSELTLVIDVVVVIIVV